MYGTVRSDVNGGAQQAWFIAGTVPLILAGGAHALATLLDTVRPTFFTPVERSAKPALEGTGIELVRMSGGGGDKPSMWRIWLGINIGFGLGVMTVGLLCLLVAAYDFELIARIDPLRPLAIAFSAAFVALSIRFWFYGPLLITATATVCFTVSALLSA
jgi:hypothetical protein